MEILLLMVLLGFASVGKALVVTLEPNSTENVHVPSGMTSTYFTLKSCDQIRMIFREGINDFPNYQIVINYDFSGIIYTLIGYGRNEGANLEIVDHVTESFPICTTPGTFWVSWGGGSLKLGEGNVVDTRTLVDGDFDADVENFKLKAYEEMATWEFPEVPETTTSTTTVSTTQMNTTLTIVTETTTDSATTSDGGQGSSSDDTSSSERETNTTTMKTFNMSKSSAPENFRFFRMFSFVMLSCFATI